MRYFPLCLRLKDSACLVAGGGEIALRKVKLLLRSGASITIVAPELHSELAALSAKGDITHLAEEFSPAHISNTTRLVIAATSKRSINHLVAESAAAKGVFCNVVDDRDLSTAIMPAIVDRSPLVIAISSGGESPVMTTRVRQQLEQMFPPAFGRLVEFAGKWRDKVKTRFPDTNLRRRFWQEIFSGPIANQVMQGEEATASVEMDQQLQQQGDNNQNGFAWIIGAGPGDAELLTLKAARVLAQADVVLHDRLVSPDVLEMVRRDAEFISVGKTAGKPSISQQEINTLLIDKVNEGLRVCRLKGGDPFIFGRGGEETEALQDAGLPWQVIPGITAAIGSAASGGIPLTHREVARSVLFLTASTGSEFAPDWQAIAKAADTLVMYMAVSKLETVCKQLINAGKAADHPVLVIENGTTDRERMLRGTLGTINRLAKDAEIVSPAILMVGEVTELARLTDSDQLRQAKYEWSAAAGN